MDSKQIFMILAIIAALSIAVIVIPVMAQNMTNGNMTGANMTGKISSFQPPPTGCPVDAEGIERCPPSQELTDSNGDANENGNGDASDDENGGDSSNNNGNDDN